MNNNIDINNNFFFYKVKPKKILCKGSQGTIILINNNNYTIKIYTKKSKNLVMLIKILNYFINCKNIPKTIYKSYHLTEKKNSLNRYISNNNLPKYFSYDNKKYNLKPLLFEVMKTYKITLKDFFEKLLMNNTINNNNKIDILTSLFYQGLYTFLWLYMKKGIVHLDINSDNFFVEKTIDEEFIVCIKNIELKNDFNTYVIHFKLNHEADVIEMIVPKPMSPNEINSKDSDTRKLGIGIKSLSFKNFSL